MSEARDGVQTEYRQRLAARRAVAEGCAGRARRISNARLVAFLLGLGVAGVAFGTGQIAKAWLWFPVLLFAALVGIHDRVLRRQRAAERSVAYYEAGLDRLEHRFAGAGATGERFRDPHHPYAEDLDLFGRGSIFELLCRARTRGGEETLARWLLEPAEPEPVRERQQAVRELVGAPDLREELAAVGDSVAPGLHPEELLTWGGSAPPEPSRWVRGVAPGLAAISTALLVALVLGAPVLPPLLAAFAVQTVFAATQRGRVRACVAALDRPLRDLELLGALLAVLERERFEAPRLIALQQAVASERLEASRRIHRLRRLADLLDARRNQLFAPLGAVLLFTTQVALAIDSWRAHFGPQLGSWLDAVAELEALASLATHGAEHPDDCFPEVASGAPHFESRDLGHPLIAEALCVRNDVRIGETPQVLLVSGSNMSGKSTLLRSVGSNAVLALAGAPVRARSLRLSPLAVGASIRVLDSLQEGASRFYAEITRLRQIVERAGGAVPALFLLDEVLHGTNSHDRLIGAEAVVRSLVERGAIGLVTTHDLALTRLEERLGARLSNVHFEDHLEGGRMSFDYRMRPGVVAKSNALELMRSVGLEV